MASIQMSPGSNSLGPLNTYDFSYHVTCAADRAGHASKAPDVHHCR
jgi:hypothetical protein